MLKNKTIFITGASSGIGKASAQQFAQAGAKLILCARRIDMIHALAIELHTKYKTQTHVLELDVRDRQQVQTSIQSLPVSWQDIDVLINNAGLAAGLESFTEGEIDDWEAMIDTNIKGLLYVTKEILPRMIMRDSGHIINIGSVAGHHVYPKGAVYCATKFAVNSITQGLRMDLLGKKIRVSTVDPGAVETNFSMVRFKGDKDRADAVYEGMIPLSADDVANAVLYCASCPPHVNISEIIIMPTDQAGVSMVSRRP